MSVDKYSYPFAWDEQEEWFKRMIEDFPQDHVRGYSIFDDTPCSLSPTAYVLWFEKWLSQFRNNKE